MVEINVGDVFTRINGDESSDYYSFKVLAVDSTGEELPEAWVYWNGQTREDLTLRRIRSHFVKVVPTFEEGKVYQYAHASSFDSTYRYECHRVETLEGERYATMKRILSSGSTKFVMLGSASFENYKEVGS